MLRIAYHKSYNHPVPEGHRFPMLKYDLLPEQLIEEGTCREECFFTPGVAGKEDVTAVHSPAYYHDLLHLNLDAQAIRRTGFIVDDALVMRELYIMQGTIDTALYALQDGISFNIAGGTHHAFSDRGEGFCLLNDNAIAASYLLRNNQVNKILIIDLDVHQGNGTASIFQDEDRVFTFSMHGKNNYPFHKERSDWDIALEDETEDPLYLSVLKDALPRLMDRVEPDFIFYQCGVDILGADKMGRLNCTVEGCRERDRLVLQYARRNSIPLACNMGGGYAPDIKEIVEAHANTYRLAMEMYF